MTKDSCVSCFVQVVWLVTCGAAVLLGLDLGLAVGLGVELISVVLRVQLLVSELSLHFNAIFFSHFTVS